MNTNTAQDFSRECTLAEARGRVIEINDAYLDGRVTRQQRVTRLRTVAVLAGYSADEQGLAALITDLLDPR